jgi:hypothetical protein
MTGQSNSEIIRAHRRPLMNTHEREYFDALAERVHGAVFEAIISSIQLFAGKGGTGGFAGRQCFQPGGLNACPAWRRQFPRC